MSSTIPKCACGCGQEVELSSVKKRRKDCWNKFILGHNSRNAEMRERLATFNHAREGENHYRWNGGQWIDDQGYVYIKIKTGERYKRRCRIVMEKELGRFLTEEEVIHHKNRIRHDDRPENLMLFASNEEHIRYHSMYDPDHGKRNCGKERRRVKAILTADIELRLYPPTCRIDDYNIAFSNKLKWLKELQIFHNCPVLDAGDLVDKKYKSIPNHFLLVWGMSSLPKQMFSICGNHDLPGKSLANYSRSAMSVFEAAGTITRIYEDEPILLENEKIIVNGYGWGHKIDAPLEEIEGAEGIKRIALVHTMVYEEFEPFPGCEGYSAKEVMDLLPDFDLIVTGHNHQTFTRKEKGRVLVNPGSLMRNDADQIDFKPSVFLWYAEDNSIEQVFVPIEEGVISREHIDVKKDKENRLDAFVEKLGEQVISGINFHDNLEAACADGAVAVGVKDKVWSYFEQGAK